MDNNFPGQAPVAWLVVYIEGSDQPKASEAVQDYTHNEVCKYSLDK